MALWQELVTTAILGSERQAAPLPITEGALGELLARLDASAPERAVLGAAAAVALYQTAGQRPRTGRAPAPEPCPLDEAPRCSAATGRHLGMMVNGERRDVLPEWLGALAAAGMRAREEHLPDLLDLGRTQADLREMILPVLGQRGHWLAAQNPDWGWVGGALDEGVWETGDRAARRWLLQALRRDDVDRGRELLASTWAEEASEDRAPLLRAFQSGLSMADEEFLEAALDDSRKEVREVAAELLARLPGSRLCRRMAERLDRLLSYTEGARKGVLAAALGRRGGLEVTLPEECDKALQRDGITRRPPTGWGEKAWWLAQMISALPPSTWPDAWQATPEDLIAAAGRNEWKAALLTGWTRATLLHADTRWAQALVVARLDRTTDADPTGLILLVPLEQREALVCQALENGGEQELGLALLQECRHPWGAALTRAALAGLQRHSSKMEWAWREAIRRLVLYMSPALIGEAEDVLAAVAAKSEGWGRATDDCTMLLRFRHDMLEEMAP